MKTLSNLTKALVFLTLVLSLVFLFGFSNPSDNKETQQDLKSLALKLIDAFNNRTPEVLDENSSPKIIYHSGSATEGVELTVRSFYDNNLAYYPDFKFTVEDIIAEGDKVVLRSFFEGTHKIYGKKVRIADHWIGRVEAGKLVEAWEIADTQGWYNQLGYSIISSENRFAGHLFCLKGDYTTAREYYKKLYEEAATSISKTNALYWQAVTYIYENKISEVLRLYKEYQAIAEQEKLSDYRIWSYSDLGDIYTELGNPTEGMKYYQKAIDLIGKVELQDEAKERFMLNSLEWQAKALIAQNELDKAKEVLKKYEQKITAKENVAEQKSLNELRGRLAMVEGNNDAALELLSKADANNPIVIYYQAVIQKKKDEEEKASKLFEKLKNWSDNSIGLAFVRNKMNQK